MVGDTDETFRRAVLLFTVGMLLPAVPVALAGDSIVSALGYRAFLTPVALGFALVATTFIERLEADRVTFLVVAVVWPWVVYVAGLFGVLLLNQGEQIPEGPVAAVFHTLSGDPRVWGSAAGSGWFTYGAAFVLAGVGAVALSTLVRRLSDGSRGTAE